MQNQPAFLAILLVLSALPGCRAREAAPPAASAGPPPTRIVSLVPAVTEILFAIGAGPRVVGVSSFDTHPPEALKLTKVGGLLDPDVERILSLKPDLLAADASQLDVIAKAKAAGIRVYAYSLGGIGNLTKTVRELGRVTGNDRQAEETASALEGRLEAVRRRVAPLGRPRTIVVFGREPGALRAIDVSGGTGFLNDILQIAGGENVFAKEAREWMRVSVEAILAASPDVVIELHYGYYLKPARIRQEQAAWATLPVLPAVRNGRVYLLEGNNYVVPGPRVVDAAEEIARLLHPATGTGKKR